MILIKAEFDARKERDCKRLAEVLTTPFDEVSVLHVVLSNIEEVSPIVDSAAHGTEEEEIPIVAPVKGVDGKGHTEVSSHC